MCLNDFDFEDASGAKIRYFRRPNSFVFEQIKPFFTGKAAVFRWGDSTKSTIQSNVDYHTWHFKNNKASVFKTITKMQRLLRDQDVEFWVAILPIFEFAKPDSDFSVYPLKPCTPR